MVTPITYQISCRRGVTSASWLPVARNRSPPHRRKQPLFGEARFRKDTGRLWFQCGFGSL